jgi:hypothetical protein
MRDSYFYAVNDFDAITRPGVGGVTRTANAPRGIPRQDRLPRKNAEFTSEPGADAPEWAWQAYFAAQERLLVDALKAEGATMASAARAMRRALPVPPPKKPPTQQEQRWRRWAAGYLREIRPLPDYPSEPCVCGDRVYYRLGREAPWRCRTCAHVDAKRRVEWWVAPPPRTATTKEPT